MERSACSFLASVSGHCSSDPKDRTGCKKRVPLLSCNRDISSQRHSFPLLQ